MRCLILTAIAALAAQQAAASSIEPITGTRLGNGSIVTRSCADCPPLPPRKKGSYQVPELTEGAQKIEIREINGEKKLVRTEKWMGGSPTVFISKVPPGMLKETEPETVATPAPDGIDLSATTSAVTGDEVRKAAAADFSGFELRLD